jgi:hypothetical protein
LRAKSVVGIATTMLMERTRFSQPKHSPTPAAVDLHTQLDEAAARLRKSPPSASMPVAQPVVRPHLIIFLPVVAHDHPCLNTIHAKTHVELRKSSSELR